MLSKHPTPEREEPATSPALARRRDHMLRSDGTRHIEPRLVPSGDDDQPSFLPQADYDAAVDEPDPEIPPPPPTALRVGSDEALRRASSAPRRRRLWPLGAAVVAIVAIAGGVWLTYGRTPAGSNGGQAPYLTADAGPEKIRPQQEGGIEVPNQDIRVYNELNGAKPTKEGEVLLPPPEAPVAPPIATMPEPQVAPPAPSAAALPPDLAPAAGTTVPPEATAAASAKDESATATVPATEPVQTATATGTFRIQLAAVKTRDAAQTAWKKLAKTYPDVFKGLSLNVVKVDRGSEGALFRVQGGPFADRTAAESACGKLKQKSQACLVVAP